LERLALRLAVGAARTKVVLSWRASISPRVGPGPLVLTGSRSCARRKEPCRRSPTCPAGRNRPRKRGRVGRRPATRRSRRRGRARPFAFSRRALREPGIEHKGPAHTWSSANPHPAQGPAGTRQAMAEALTPADGVVQPIPTRWRRCRRTIPRRAPIPPTALQNYAACPYKFVLQAIHRLAPREVPGGNREESTRSRDEIRL